MWRTIEKYGIPSKILSLIRDMCKGFRCEVLREGKLTEYIKVTTEVLQGCILSPIILLLVLDRVMRRMMGGRKRWIHWGMRDRIEVPGFADDMSPSSKI
jgi:hypothetical protein